jgi:hypothetical protein
VFEQRSIVTLDPQARLVADWTGEAFRGLLAGPAAPGWNTER